MWSFWGAHNPALSFNMEDAEVTITKRKTVFKHFVNSVRLYQHRNRCVHFWWRRRRRRRRRIRKERERERERECSICASSFSQMKSLGKLDTWY
jgi:hypothetical protein